MGFRYGGWMPGEDNEDVGPQGALGPRQPSILPPAYTIPDQPFAPAPMVAPAAPIPRALDRINQSLALKPIALNSGLQQTASLEEMGRNMKTTRTDTRLDRGQLLGNAADVALLPALQKEEQGQEANKKLFQMEMAMPHPVDYASPLSYLAHYWDPHSPVLPSTQNSTGLGEKEIREWSKQQQDDQRDIARILVSGMNASKNGYINDLLLSQLTNKAGEKAGGSEGAGSNKDANNWNKWKTDTDKVMSKYVDSIMEGKMVMSLVNGPAVAQRDIPLKMAKMLTGSARITNMEMVNSSGDPGVKQRFEQWWDKNFHDLGDDEKAIAGRMQMLSETNKAEYTQFVNDFLTLQKEGMTALAKPQIYSAAHAGVDPQAAGQYIDQKIAAHPTAMETPKETPKKKILTPGAGGDPGMDAFLQNRGK